jgi:hypothetical protein
MEQVTEEFPVLFTIQNGTGYWNEKFTHHHTPDTVHFIKPEKNST